MWMCSCQIITPIFSGAKLTLAGIPVTNALSENSGAKLTLAGIPVTNALSENKTSFFTNHVYFMPF